MTAEPIQPEFDSLYHRAFADFRLRALWNVRELEHPTAEEALVITRSQPNTKPYDGTVTAAAVPLVTGLLAADTVTGATETYDTPYAGSGKTLSVAAYTVNDGNGGRNYSVKTIANTSGVIGPRRRSVIGSVLPSEDRQAGTGKHGPGLDHAGQ